MMVIVLYTYPSMHSFTHIDRHMESRHKPYRALLHHPHPPIKLLTPSPFANQITHTIPIRQPHPPIKLLTPSPFANQLLTPSPSANPGEERNMSTHGQLDWLQATPHCLHLRATAYLVAP